MTKTLKSLNEAINYEKKIIQHLDNLNESVNIGQKFLEVRDNTFKKEIFIKELNKIKTDVVLFIYVDEDNMDELSDDYKTDFHYYGDGSIVMVPTDDEAEDVDEIDELSGYDFRDEMFLKSNLLKLVKKEKIISLKFVFDEEEGDLTIKLNRPRKPKKLKKK